MDGLTLKHLTLKQLNFISEMCKDDCVSTVCEKLNISRATYYKWLKEPAFAKYLKQMKGYIYTESMESVKDMFMEALLCYRTLLKSENENMQFRVARDIVRNRETMSEAHKLADYYKELIERHDFYEYERDLAIAKGYISAEDEPTIKEILERRKAEDKKR